jgi:DNA-3-methyladenine glycosylase II
MKRRSIWWHETPDPRWQDAIDHLSHDRTLARIIARVGPCTLRPRRGTFAMLVQSILSQQVSVKAAEAMHRRLVAGVGGRLAPARVKHFLDTASDDAIRDCGLSRQKRAYIHDLAGRFTDGSIPVRKLTRMSDEQVIETLTQVKGIGRWTVEMLLIFGLNRPDVWPVDDLGLREGICRTWPDRFKARPAAKDLSDFADAWRPWRSVASWYLWRSKDGVRTTV